jgi:hypothetical protein
MSSFLCFVAEKSRVKLARQGEAEIFGEEPVLVVPGPPQTADEMAWD